MNRHGKSLAVLAAALLLSGVAAGCSRSGGTDVPAAPPPSVAATMAPETSAVEPVDSPASLETQAASPSPSASSTDLTAPSTATAVSPIPASTNDPLDAELQDVNQLLNGIDGSVSDSSTGGGE